MWIVSLALRYAVRNPVQTGLLAVSLAVTVAIPVTSRLLVDEFDRRMSEQAEVVPLVVGPRGSRFDLVLSAVFYREPPDRTISMAVAEEIASVPGADVLPVNALFTASGRRLVCVGPGFFGYVGLEPARGTLPLIVGDATIGAGVARDLGLDVGDTITSDRHELFDLSVPPPITMSVVGVLEPTGTSADQTVFSSMETAWLVGGQSHSHADVDELEGDDLIAASDRAVAIKPTLDTDTTVTAESVLEIHGHLSPTQLPLSSVLVFADDPKPLTLAAARFEGDEAVQAVRPREVIAEMLRTVVRVQRVFDAIVALLALGTLLLVILTTSLAARLRVQEFQILESVGAPRGFRPVLLMAQLVLVTVVAVGLAAALVAGAFALLSSVQVL